MTITKDTIESIADVRTRGNRYMPADEIAELKRLAVVGHALASLSEEQRAYLVNEALDKAHTWSCVAIARSDDTPSVSDAAAKKSAAHKALAEALR